MFDPDLFDLAASAVLASGIHVPIVTSMIGIPLETGWGASFKSVAADVLDYLEATKPT